MNPIAEDAFATMERHLTDVTVDLFDAYGMQIKEWEKAPGTALTIDDRSIVAFIGYAADCVRGSLVLVASKMAVDTWVAAAFAGADSTADACDTLGEFANMLLGRLKGRLLPDGFPILLSTPTTASGTGLRLSRALHPSSVFSFIGPDWRLDVRIDATFDDNFALQATEERSAAAEAGDMMMF